MSPFDYTQSHDMTDEQIVADVTLLYPHDHFRGISVDILQDGMQRFCPSGLRCCFGRWRNDLETMIYFPETQSSPTSQQIIAAFYMKFVLIHHEENKEGNWLWD